jgi:hypothetical protein
MIAAGSKKRVASLHELLRKAAEGELPARLFSIVDKDGTLVNMENQHSAGIGIILRFIYLSLISLLLL